MGHDESDPIRSDPILRQALKILDQRALEPLFRLSDLATAVGRSKWYLSSRLKRITGRNLCQHLHDRRVSEAMELLAGTALTVKEVAAAVGYGRHSDFDREFRRRAGMTPKDWRSENTSR